MAMHLFSTPVECKKCGTVVDDPTVDRCPKCKALLKERRNPSRLAGVERRYGNLRFLLGFLRFLGVITALVGIMLFLFADQTVPFAERMLSLFGPVMVGVTLFVVAALLDVALDLEENTRAAFRIQQLVLQALTDVPAAAAPPVEAHHPTESPPELPRQDART
jgi:hypothetical protein